MAVESFVVLEHAATLGTLDRLGWPAHTHTSIIMHGEGYVTIMHLWIHINCKVRNIHACTMYIMYMYMYMHVKTS